MTETGGHGSGDWLASIVPIVAPRVGKVDIGWTSFDWAVKEDQLLAWSEKVLEVFEQLEVAVNGKARALRNKKQPVRDSVTLPEEACEEHLKTLALYGQLAYRGVFRKEARDLLTARFATMEAPLVPAPTFVSELTPFPWEVLFLGNHNNPAPEEFWGAAFQLARILDMEDFSKYTPEQASVSRMLFCLHHGLCQAHQEEWPAIERMVKASEQDDIRLLGPLDPPTVIEDGESLLSHLYRAGHNMLHFACHAKQLDAGNDALLVSLISVDELLSATETDLKAPVITLDTNTFMLEDGSFQVKPLVFLNACQSGGGSDELRDSYNLPKKFIEHGAAAIIATACPVPDVFAAEFARIFYGFFLWGRVIDDEGAIPPRAEARPLPIGEALRLTRLHFLKVHHNPLGLAYGLYSPARYRVQMLGK